MSFKRNRRGTGRFDPNPDSNPSLNVLRQNLLLAMPQTNWVNSLIKRSVLFITASVKTLNLSFNIQRPYLQPKYNTI